MADSGHCQTSTMERFAKKYLHKYWLKLKRLKDLPQKNSLYSGKMELSNSKFKKLLAFSQKKAFLILLETQTLNKSL